MALNLMTPRYVAPDVTKAPLAAESIRSSQASTNLAAQAQATRDRAQQAQEQQFRAQLGLSAKEQAEASAARRGNLALGWERADQGWEELGLRAEAQSVNLANTEQQMRHREDRLPFEIDALALANEAQDLKNELDYATMDERKEKVRLGNKNLRADIMGKRVTARSINQATNFAETNQATKERQEGNFASYQSQMDAAINMGYYDFIQDMVFEDVNPAQAQSLREMQTKIAGREASKAAMATKNRLNVNAINQSTANQAVIGKLPTVAMQGFWRQANVTNFSGNTQYTDGNGMLTPEGQAALSAQAEWLGLNLTQSDTDQLMTMPVGSSQGQGWLLSGNPAGEKFLNGSMFIPTEEALQEAKALKAKQRADFRATFEPQEAEDVQHGMKVKLKSGKVVEREEAQAIVSEVRQAFDAIIDGGVYEDTPAGRSLAFKEALTGAKIAAGQITVYEHGDDFKHIKVGETYYDYHETDPTKMIKIWQPKPHDAAPSVTEPPVQTGDKVKTGGRVYEAQHELQAQLIDRGLTPELANFVINEAVSGRSMMKDDWDVDDPTAGMLEQARRREHKRALAVKETIAENLFDLFWGEDENDVNDFQIKKLENYLDKPYWEWPALTPVGHSKDPRQPNAAEVAKLKKAIPKYLEHYRRQGDLLSHLESDQFKGESREY